MSQINRPRIKNRKNKTWLHEHRQEIFKMLQQGETLQTIAEHLQSSAEQNGKKVSKQIVSSYVLRYPLEIETVQIPQEPKQGKPLQTTKQITKNVFSSVVEENRAESQTDFITPNEQEIEPENQPENSKNPFRKLIGKVGRTKPDSDDTKSIF